MSSTKDTTAEFILQPPHNTHPPPNESFVLRFYCTVLCVSDRLVLPVRDNLPVQLLPLVTICCMYIKSWLIISCLYILWFRFCIRVSFLFTIILLPYLWNVSSCIILSPRLFLLLEYFLYLVSWLLSCSPIYYI